MQSTRTITNQFNNKLCLLQPHISKTIHTIQKISELLKTNFQNLNFIKFNPNFKAKTNNNFLNKKKSTKTKKIYNKLSIESKKSFSAFN